MSNNNFLKSGYGSRILANGIAVSNDTRETQLNNNDIIIGTSGSGKTSGYVIPNLQNIEGSLVVSDTKGFLEKRFKKELQEKGYNVCSINFVNPMDSCGYNPLDAIRRNPDGSVREQDILTLSRAIVPCRMDHDPFWDKAAQNYVAFLIAFVMATTDDRSERTMTSVCRVNELFNSDEGIAQICEWTEKNPEAFATKRFRELRAISPADKTLASIIGVANEALCMFEFKEAEHIFCGEKSFDIRTLGRKKTVLFLNVSDCDSTFDQFVNIFYAQALQLLCAEADSNPSNHLDVPVRFIMDDFASSARIENFDKIISVIRSRDISVSIILQSMTQLESMYSKAEADTIINNCDHMIYLGSQDITTSEYVAYRAFTSVESVICMPRKKAYLLTSGERGRLVDKILPHQVFNTDSMSFDNHDSNVDDDEPPFSDKELE